MELGSSTIAENYNSMKHRNLSTFSKAMGDRILEIVTMHLHLVISIEMGCLTSYSLTVGLSGY